MITVREAARRAGRNPETIRRWIRDIAAWPDFEDHED
jgi:transposase-like protein